MKTIYNEITILGSGTSTGIPMIGCSCDVCTSSNSHNKRLRTSIFIKSNRSKHFLIDTTPDLRTQILAQDINKIDFVIIGHTHADHIHGIDDLRPFCFKKKSNHIDLYCSKIHSKELTSRFPYIFKRDNKPVLGGGIPIIKLNEINTDKKALFKKTIQGEKFQFFTLPHNYTYTMCFVHKSFVYIPDCNHIPKEIITALKKIKPELLIINCLQILEHDTHLNVDKCFKYIKEINPKKAGLIHMNHHLEHAKLENLAKQNFDFPVFPVYDGQILKYR